MEIKFDCIPCIYRQILESCRMATDDKEIIREIMNDYARMIPGIEELYKSAPMLVSNLQQIIKDKTGVEDPYRKFKEENIKLAQNLYSNIKDIIDDSEDPLLKALIISACGNVIDAGVSLNFDINESIENAVKDGFAYSDFDEFKQKLNNDDGVKILIVADNSGEGVFDKILLDELNKYNAEVTYAVREVPVLNDITLKEAREIGINNKCTLISSGCEAPGMILDSANSEFMRVYNKADIVISKGQGNLEGLSKARRQIFFLLKAKCELVADLLNVEVGDLVFKLKS